MIKICKIFYDHEEGLIFNSDNNKHEVFHSRSKFGSLLFDDLVFFGYIDESKIEFVESISKVNEDTIVVIDQNHDIPEKIYDRILNLNPKKFIFDYSSHDCTNRWLEVSSIIEVLKDKDFKIITKSVDFDEHDNLLYYDQQLSRMIFWIYPDIKFNTESDYSKFNRLDFSSTLDSFYNLKKIMNKDYLLPVKKGMFFVGHPRYHKIDLLNHIFLNGHLNDIWWTSSDINYDLGAGSTDWGGENLPIKDSISYNEFEVLKLLPKKLDYSYESSEHDLVSIGITVSWPLYLDSCFDIIGETDFVLNDNSVHHISEKTIKPILLGIPFVSLNASNTLFKLEKNFGFNFERGDSLFSIDYDGIKDEKIRMDKIKGNVDDILKTSSKVLKDYSYSYKEKYRENTDILLKVFWRESVKKIGDYINE